MSRKSRWKWKLAFYAVLFLVGMFIGMIATERPTASSKAQIEQLQEEVATLEQMNEDWRVVLEEYREKLATLQEQRGTPTGENSTSHTSTTKTPTVLPMGTIPNDVTYSIIHDNVIPGTKRTVNIRLNQRVSENVLRSIALEVKGQDTREYEYTFILYYLPGMEVGAGAWATTHFNPELEVVFLGASPEELAVIANMPIDPSREVIGVWFWELPAEYSHRVTIYYLNHTPYMEKNFLDGSGSTEELVEKTSSRGRRFEVKDRSYGEYFLLDSQGNLHLGDEEGLFETLQKIE